MISPATAEFIRLLISDIRSEDRVVRVYHVARQIPTLNGGHDMKELAEFIAQEAVQQRANVSWDRDDGAMSDGHDNSQHGDGTA
jgi:hypothetical protein